VLDSADVECSLEVDDDSVDVLLDAEVVLELEDDETEEELFDSCRLVETEEEEVVPPQERSRGRVRRIIEWRRMESFKPNKRDRSNTRI